MIAKSVAVTVALVLVASASQAQMAPTNIDQAIYVTCRQAHAMNPEARKALAMGVPRQPCAVKADAAGITYAVERGWLRISGGLHSLTLTEAGHRRVKYDGNWSAERGGVSQR
jgi:hypothetical protein